MDFETIREALASDNGPHMRIMEICGSHTDAIAKNGIPSILNERITLLTGPGCPVCVATSSYIDRLVEIASEGTTVVTFGDLIRVPGSQKSLEEARGTGAQVEMVYSPMDILSMAVAEPEREFVFAAVGFETTAPVYSLLIEEMISQGIKNIKLLTAMKTMPAAVEYMMSGGSPVDGFLAPGHVCVVTGADVFAPIAEKYGIPFAVSGFHGRELMAALYSLQENAGRGVVKNCYPAVVSGEGNVKAWNSVMKYFEHGDAAWRGLGVIPESGLYLREEYRKYDAGSFHLDSDTKKNKACHCDKILTGREKPADCPLFAKTCHPGNPQGACMVSTEGSCYSAFVHKKFTKNC
ncbi:MAG: hydrogenase formation protein HypD [Eubacterium sp.]|nr:hydrogenase formation protein HypD [Eubacterium sp.]